MILIGIRTNLDLVKQSIQEVYAFKDLGPITDAIFLGIHIVRNRTNRIVYLDQHRYATSILTKFDIHHGAPIPMETKTHFPHDSPQFNTTTYQSAIGSLLYLTLGTRPDLAYAVNKLAQYSTNSTEAHWSAVKK